MQINRVLAGFHSPSDHLWKPIFTGLSKFQCIPTPHPISLWRLGNFLRFVAGRMVVVGANNRSISTTISSCYNGKNRRISRWRPIFRKNSTQFFALLHSYSFFCRARFLFKSCYKLYEKKDNQKMYISIFKNWGGGMLVFQIIKFFCVVSSRLLIVRIRSRWNCWLNSWLVHRWKSVETVEIRYISSLGHPILGSRRHETRNSARSSIIRISWWDSWI